MYKRHYLDPLGNHLPALERNIIRLRSLQMVLVLFYAERLRQKLIDLIQTSDRLRASFDNKYVERVPKGTKDTLRKCLNALVIDKALTNDEKDEIKRLLDYRNTVAHDLHELTADVTIPRLMRNYIGPSQDKSNIYDYGATDRLRYYLKLLDERQHLHGYIGTLRMHVIMFASTEKTLLADIGGLHAKIERQIADRKVKIHELNKELAINGSTRIEEHPDHPLNHYNNKRLTKRGEEICYRLFDQGKSPTAVAHLMHISLPAARRRHKMWQAIGGKTRPSIDLNALPHRKFYRRHED